MSTRVTVNFNKQVNEALERLAEKHGMTKTDVLRRALTLYDYVERETSRTDQGRLKLGLVDDLDQLRKEIVLS